MLIIIYILYILRNISNLAACFSPFSCCSSLSAPYRSGGLTAGTYQIGCKISTFFLHIQMNLYVIQHKVHFFAIFVWWNQKKAVSLHTFSE